MNPQHPLFPANTSRQAEEQHLQDTLAVIQDNLDNYRTQVSAMQADIDEMLEHYHDNDAEVYTILNNTITLHDHMERALQRNEKALFKPYFGRIDYHDELLNKNESLYIGRGGISKDTTHQVVIDWRAPVANAYYENSLGKCSYTAPDGKQLQIDLKLKRTYEIDNGRLLDYFDSEVIANDDLLTKYLAKNKQAVLGEVVATIQKEQNEIIRRSPYHNIIVQGVAGSGKTTVAMHRISFILYNYAERFRPNDFYIVGSNRILLNYITGVLPDLDVHGVRQMTMEQLFIRLLYEDWNEKKYRVRPVRQGTGGAVAKGRTAWYEDLKAFCDEIEWDTILRDSIYLNRKQFVEGLRNGKSGVYDLTLEQESRPEDLILLIDGQAVERYILQNPRVSVQSKINMLNERLLNKVKEEFWGKGISYTEAERKAIIKAYRGRYGSKVWKKSIFELYREFLHRQISKGIEVDIPGSEFDVYDLASLAYLYKRLKETEVISEAHHIVIDEAQDFGMMAYRVLNFCVQGCTYTIMGDVSQNIHFGFGLNDWEELRELLLSDEMSSFDILKKSYRNTVEISEFATRILHHGSFSSYPVEPIIRHGDPVRLLSLDSRENLMKKAADICRAWQEKGFETIAVVCRDQKSADRTARELGEYIDVMEHDLEKAVFGTGIMVLPVEYTKGLEFDTVLILDPTRTEYPVDDGHAKLLYVAATRALHELCVLSQGDLTGLIADPIPEKAAKAMPDKDKGTGTSPNEQDTPNAVSVRPPVSGFQRPRPSAVPRQKPTASLRQPPNDLMSRYAAPVPKASLGSKNSPAPTAAAPSPRTVHRPAFGDLPPTELLRPIGHSKIDLSVRWATKQADGLYLQSRYGTLRLSPVGSGIVRVTFAKSGFQPLSAPHPLIKVGRTEKYWMYKDNGNTIELTTDELLLRLDKSTGALQYLTRDKKILLTERKRECRQLESLPNGTGRAWIYLDWSKEEHLFALGSRDQGGLPLRSTAKYISGEKDTLPFLFSDKGYGILPAANGPVLFCDLPNYGSYLYLEDTPQLDYYFIIGKKRETVWNAYTYLTGNL